MPNVVGDIKQYRDIYTDSPKNYGRVIWAKCVDCGKERWTDYAYYCQYPQLRCRDCASVARRLNRVINDSTPKDGEVRRGFEIGRTCKTAMQFFMWQPCPICYIPRWVKIRSLRNRELTSNICVSCLSKNMPKGEKHSRWIKSGKIVDRRSGYVKVRILKDDFFYPMVPKSVVVSYLSYVLEHRLIMARHLGRCLQDWEIVHHKNGIKDDNRIENLELSSPGEHSIQHSKGYRDGYTRGYNDGQNRNTIQ